MPIAIQNLPDDIEMLKRLVIEQQERIEQRESESLHLLTWIEKLKLEIARLKRMSVSTRLVL